jgi:hypothetical protein
MSFLSEGTYYQEVDVAYDSEYHKQYYEQNRKQKLKRAIDWQRDNAERHNEHVAAYAKKRPEVGRNARQKYFLKHRGTVPYIQREMVTRAKARAKRGNYSFNITVEDVQRMWPADNKCPVYGTPFDLSGGDLQQTASLDKIVPDRGYVPDNIVIVSYRANSIKKDSTLAELKRLVEYYTQLVNQQQEVKK